RRAIQNHCFKDEIVTLDLALKAKRGEARARLHEDEHPRSISMDSIAGLKPVFQEGGTVTAANASGINDGAAAVLLMSERKARALGLQPMARIVANACTVVDPSIMGIGPVSAVQQVLRKT